MEGCFMFQWEASFVNGGDHGGASVLAGGGGFEKNCNDVSPHYGKAQYPCANLNCLRSIGTIFITTEID